MSLLLVGKDVEIPGTDMEQSMHFAAMAGYVLVLFAAERLFPLRKSTRSLRERLAINLIFAVMAVAVTAGLLRPAVAWVLGRGEAEGFGLVRLLPQAPLLQGTLAFVLMDLSFYWWHRANHHIPLLWRFHNVHHFDPDLDVSTAFRFHFGELACSVCFRFFQVSVIGISASTYLLYESVFQTATLFHHSNLRLPFGLERVLVLFMVTPRMHGIHHSQVPGETNSNYSTVFSIWDRLFRTIGLDIPQPDIEIGIPGYAESRDNRLLHTLTAPFRRQRDYWHRADGSLPKRTGTVGNKGRLEV